MSKPVISEELQASLRKIPAEQLDELFELFEQHAANYFQTAEGWGTTKREAEEWLDAFAKIRRELTED
jgi:hypothetical protein